jgi:hypothetical protein
LSSASALLDQQSKLIELPENQAGPPAAMRGKYRWFTKYVLENHVVYCPIRSVVKLLRRGGIVSG